MLPEHFRPISILPFPSKVLEACVYKQLSQFVYRNQLLNLIELGFRSGHRTVTSLLQVIDIVNRDLELIKSCSLEFGLSINPTKCQAIIVGNKRIICRLDTTSIPSINFNCEVIPFSPEVKDLCLLIDSTLDWRFKLLAWVNN